MANTSGTGRTNKSSKPPSAATGTEAARQGAQAVVEGRRQLIEDAARRFGEASREVAGAAEGDLPDTAEGGVPRMTQALAHLGNPASVVELQQRFVREYTDTLLQSSAALVSAVRRTADEMLNFTKAPSRGNLVRQPAQVEGGVGGGDAALDDLLEREAERFKVAAGRVAALAGTAVEAAKAGNDRIEANNARLRAALEAFQNRG